MKIGLAIIILLVALLFAPSVDARGSGGGFTGSHAAFASPHAATHSRPVFLGSQRVIVAHQRFARPPMPPRPLIVRHRVVVAPAILLTTPAFAAPVFIIIRPVCCG
jgi:hypothetical protein